MTDAAVPVDLFHPGQVFACLGLMELSLTLCGDVRCGFDWSDPQGACFRFRVAGEQDPLERCLAFLGRAQVCSVAPSGSASLETEKWGVSTVRDEDGTFPFKVPSSPATLPARLEVDGASIDIDHWGDTTRRDNVKFWGGAGGYPGAGLVRDALDLVRTRLERPCVDPFAVSAPQSSSFRFDWRRDYVPIDAGFSLNMHNAITPGGFPLVEVLAALGLGNSRPRRETKLLYHYGVVGRAEAAASAESGLLPPALIRAALGASLPAPFPARLFQMNLGWPAKEGQARCITTVIEETP